MKTSRETAAIAAELRFLRQYNDAIQYFNLLDVNMAYCLAWSERYAGTEPDMQKIHSLSYDAKLKKISALIKRRKLEPEYGEFSSLAEQCRLLRNRLVHGRWELRSYLAEKAIAFRVLAPLGESGYMTHDEFAALTRIFERTLRLFNKLRETQPIERPPKPAR